MILRSVNANPIDRFAAIFSKTCSGPRRREEESSNEAPWGMSSLRHSCRSRRCGSTRRGTTQGVPLHFHSSTTLGSACLDQSAEAGKHLSAPVAWLLDSRVYQSRCRFDSLYLRLLWLSIAYFAKFLTLTGALGSISRSFARN